MAPVKLIVQQIPIDEIDIGGNRRPIHEAAVEALAQSIQEIGLRTPITVRREDVYTEDGKHNGERWTLIAGRHRLEAVRRLGQEKIDVIFVDTNDIDAELWEIAENLHRAELTVLEHDQQAARWIELKNEKLQLTQGVSIENKRPDRRGHRPESGVRAAARELGINREAARRAVKVASLSEEAKQAARDAGLDDNRSALLAAAKHSTPEAQVAALQQHNVVAVPDVPLTDEEVAERECAALIALWEKTGDLGRQRFRERIDGIPVFLRRVK